MVRGKICGGENGTYTVVVSVLDGETGEPISDAEVYFDALLAGRTAPDGKLTLRVSEGYHTIGAWKKGYRFEPHTWQRTWQP
ncbi:MAG: hypothetical protein JRD89_15880 [Deltaproteobacteria bacterium]|nr:hypothetical protein [Deltaproteobacteria bacterium]